VNDPKATKIDCQVIFREPDCWDCLGCWGLHSFSGCMAAAAGLISGGDAMLLLFCWIVSNYSCTSKSFFYIKFLLYFFWRVLSQFTKNFFQIFVFLFFSFFPSFARSARILLGQMDRFIAGHGQTLRRFICRWRPKLWFHTWVWFLRNVPGVFGGKMGIMWKRLFLASQNFCWWISIVRWDKRSLEVFYFL